MKTKKEIIQFLKLAFGVVEGATTDGTTTDTPTAYKLKDGTEVTVSKLEVGGMVQVAGVPAPANTYELEDGTIMVVDASGLITTITMPAAAAAATPPATPPAAGQQLKYEITTELQTADGMRKLWENFATGTPEERLANLELCAKALMEYSFGYEIRKAKEDVDRAAAIKVYTDQLAKAQETIAIQQQAMAAMVPLLEELAAMPSGEPPEETKKSFSFSNTEVKNKSLAKYAKAMQELTAQSKN